jgi:hypothetical protein
VSRPVAPLPCGRGSELAVAERSGHSRGGLGEACSAYTLIASLGFRVPEAYPAWEVSAPLDR